jgi:hypothetical protein
MTVTVDSLQSVADQLLEALDLYDRFVDGWPYERGAVPNDIERFVAELDGSVYGSETELGLALATVVTERYYEACETQAKYVEQTREQGCANWSQIVEETEPVRGAIRRVHTAGYGINPETGEPDYLLPRETCPAQLVSMNTGSSPVVFEDRVTQYRAVADHFDLSPELVYHPGSGHDVSTSEAFPESRVVYVDVDKAAVDDLDRAGYEAVDADATAYELAEKADVIVFRNAGLVEEAIVDANLRPGGWVLANDHLESATHLSELDSLELVGRVPDTWMDELPEIVESHRQTSGSGPAGKETKPSQLFEKGTPLDLYIFRERA